MSSERIHADDINILGLVKGSERYIFIYSDERRDDVLLKIGQFASHPDLSFTWVDATKLAARVRQQGQEATA